MSIMNRRAVLVKPREPLMLEEKPIHATPPTGVVVKTQYAGICHSDLHLWENELAVGDGSVVQMMADTSFPTVLGHEISGVIHDIGREVNADLKIGDRVLVYSWMGCKACGLCKGGRENICEKGFDFYVGCSPTEGGYQQYVAVANAADVVKVPDNVPMDVAALLACSALTAYNAATAAKSTVEEFVRLNGKATLLVVGAGGLGQWAIQIAKALFPDKVTVVSADISEEKVALGKQAGADETLVWPISASKSEIVEYTKTILPGGINVSLDFVNNPTTAGRVVEILSKGGIAVQVGLFGGSAHTVPLGYLPLKNISIVGAFTGNHTQQAELLDLVSVHDVKPPPIFHVKLEEAFDYLNRLKEGKVNGRAIIDFIHF